MREFGIDPKLEAEAEKLLKQDWKKSPFLTKTGRGFQKYADNYGIRTKKHDEKARQVEITGLDMEHSMRPIGVRHSKRIEEDE